LGLQSQAQPGISSAVVSGFGQVTSACVLGLSRLWRQAKGARELEKFTASTMDVVIAADGGEGKGRRVEVTVVQVRP
jgi:hypothetical protein